MEKLLRFYDNTTRYEDLILRFADESKVCDSYYLALDQSLLPRREDSEKVRVVLRRPLEQWLEAVETARDGRTVYLPFDFSDQYTGWLRCHRSDNSIDVDLGTAIVEGFSFSPSAVGAYLTRRNGFRSHTAATRVPRDELSRLFVSR